MADSFYTAITNSSGFGGVQRYVRAQNVIRGAELFVVSADHEHIIPLSTIFANGEILSEFKVKAEDFPNSDINVLNNALNDVVNQRETKEQVYIRYQGKVIRIKNHLFVKQDTKAEESKTKEKFYVANRSSLDRKGVVDSTKNIENCYYISTQEITPPAFRKRESFEVVAGRTYDTSNNNFDVISYTGDDGKKHYIRDAEFGVDDDGFVWVNKRGTSEERVRTNTQLTVRENAGRRFFMLPSDNSFSLYTACDINAKKTVEHSREVVDNDGNVVLDSSGNPVVEVVREEVSSVDLIQTSKIDEANKNEISAWCPQDDKLKLERFAQDLAELREELAYISASDNETENQERLEQYRERLNAILEPVKDIVKVNPQGEYQRKSVKDLVDEYQKKCESGGFYPTTVFVQSDNSNELNKCEISTDYTIDMTADLPYDWSQSKTMKSIIGKDTIANNKPSKFHPDGSISVKFNPKTSAVAEGALGLASMMFQASFGFGPFSILLWPVTLPGTLISLGVSVGATVSEFIRTKIYKTAKINWYTRDPQRIKNLEIKAIQKECEKDLNRLHREYKKEIIVAKKRFSNIGFAKDAEGNLIKDEFGVSKTPLRKRLDELEKEYQRKRAEIISRPNLMANAIMKSKYTVKDKKITAENILGRAEFVKQRRELKEKKKFADVTDAQKKEVRLEIDEKLKQTKQDIKQEKKKKLNKQLRKLNRQIKKASDDKLISLNKEINRVSEQAKVLENLKKDKKAYKKDRKLAGKDSSILERYDVISGKTEDGSVIVGYKTRKAELKRLKKDKAITRKEYKKELEVARVEREKEKVDFFKNNGNLSQQIEALKETPEYQDASLKDRKKMIKDIKEKHDELLKKMSIETVRVSGKTDAEIKKFVKGLEKQEKRVKSKQVKENFKEQVDEKAIILNQNERLIKRKSNQELDSIVGENIDGIEEITANVSQIQSVLNTNEAGVNASAKIQNLATSSKQSKQANEDKVVQNIKTNLETINASSSPAKDMLKRFKETGELKHLAHTFADGKKIVDGREPTEKEILDYFVTAIKDGNVDEQQLMKNAGLKSKKVERSKKSTTVLVDTMQKDGKLSEESKQVLTDDLSVLAKTYDRITREQQKKKDPNVKLPKKTQSEKELTFIKALIKQNSPEHTIAVLRDSQIFKTEYARDVKKQTQDSLDKIEDKDLAKEIEKDLSSLAKAYYETLPEDKKEKGKFGDMPSQEELEKIFVDSLSKNAELEVEMLKRTATFKAEKKRLREEKKTKAEANTKKENTESSKKQESVL